MVSNPVAEKNESLTVGIDLGGSKVDISIVASDGTVITSSKHPTYAHKGPQEVIASVIIAIETLFRETSRKADIIGVGVAGQIDKESGIVRFSPNLFWHDVPLQSILEESLHIPVILNNDVRAATWAEWKYGAGRGIDDLVCLFIGTGIGGGIVSSGQLLEGCNNAAGEIGHATIVAGGRPCRCPNSGCLEAYAGGWAIAQRAQEYVMNDPENGRRLLDLAGDVTQITAATVTQAYREADPLAGQIVAETAHYLAAGMTSLVNMLNPCVLILGGGVIAGLPDYVAKSDAIVRQNALRSAVERLQIVTASLGDQAGPIGAAMLARHMVDSG
ncbi:MAG TPA: ROK family protein [Dehalococcoidia bacterium]|nr:ROK family protein [Dehalococcoidia bacterium]